MYTLKIVGFQFDLFGHLVIVHLEKLRSKYVHSENFQSLWICGWICVMLLVRMAKLAYAMMLHVIDEVLKW